MPSRVGTGPQFPGKLKLLVSPKKRKYIYQDLTVTAGTIAAHPGCSPGDSQSNTKLQLESFRSDSIDDNLTHVGEERER